MGPRGPQTASKAVNMHETIVRACLVDHMHVMGPGGASPHTRLKGMKCRPRTPFDHVKGNRPVQVRRDMTAERLWIYKAFVSLMPLLHSQARTRCDNCDEDARALPFVSQ